MEGSQRTRKSSSSERSAGRRGSRSPPPPNCQHHSLLNTNAGSGADQKRKLLVGEKAAVVYYLSRSWQLEHPHFVEVTVSSPEGLFLRDVISRLRVLRGRRVAAMYSWSCKRSYKSGFVWHDVSEDDLILPASGNEYVLKGSEILDVSPSDARRTSITVCQTPSTVTPRLRRNLSPPQPDDSRTPSSSSESPSPEPSTTRPAKAIGKELDSTPRANASTQTDQTTAQSERCASPSSSTKAPENTLEALIRAEPPRLPRMMSQSGKDERKARAGHVIKQLLSCGAAPHNGRPRRTTMGAANPGETMEGRAKARVRRREWYSGSLVEMHRRRDKGEGGGEGSGVLMRSSSQGENRSHGLLPETSRRGGKDQIFDRIASLDGVIIDPTGTMDEKKKKNTMTAKGGVETQVAESPRVSSRVSISRNISTTNGASRASSSQKGTIRTRLAPLRIEEKGKTTRIEERLVSGARVIIQSRPQSEDSDGSRRSL